MNMLDGLSDIGGNALAKVLRRTVISSLIVGAAGVILVLVFGYVLGSARHRHRPRHGDPESPLPRRRRGQAEDRR